MCFWRNISCKGRFVNLGSAPEKEMDRKVKAETISEFGAHEKDTGSADVQIAVLSRRIKHLEGHLKANKKDRHSRRGLTNMVSRRKRLLRYLQGKDSDRMVELKKQLGIR
jgi:small subunit ribosomal protein S15